MVQHPHHLKSALLCTWVTLGDGGSYLGIGSDAHGLYRTPPPALRTLRSDFHFARDHSLAVGEPPLLLSEISAFGGSMHLQLDVMGSNASTFALELSVLGGASTVSVEHIAPPLLIILVFSNFSRFRCSLLDLNRSHVTAQLTVLLNQGIWKHSFESAT